MSNFNPDSSLLLIRCPSCGQRFKVGEDFRGRSVECGGCEHRFRIQDEVIVRGRKFYPGERSNPALNRFQRVPLPGGEALIGVQPVRYSNMPDPAVLEPASPQRIMAGGIGVAGMVVMALLLMFGTGHGGILDGMMLPNRLLMAGFAGVLGIILLVYANPRARAKALVVGLILSAGVVAVPFFFTAGSAPLPHTANGAGNGSQPGERDRDAAKARALEALRGQISTGPLEAEIERLAKSGSHKRAVGVWLRNLTESHKNMVRDHMLRVTGADPGSHSYPRDGGNYLLVLTGVSQSLEEVAELAAALGEVKNLHPEISVVEVEVNNAIFVEEPLDKLVNKEDPGFYDLNKRELESVDLARVRRAVQRLAGAEPKIYRTDITRKLIALLGEDSVEFKGDICKALAVWSERPDVAAEAAMAALKKLMEKHAAVPQELVSLIVQTKNPAVVPILDELWLASPSTWEHLYAAMGPLAEAAVIKGFPKLEGTIRYSAVRILGRVGGADSLPVLAAAGVDANPEMKVLIEQARKSISDRTER